eukprot:1595405-Prymnesium_polylepis.1
MAPLVGRPAPPTRLVSNVDTLGTDAAGTERAPAYDSQPARGARASSAPPRARLPRQRRRPSRRIGAFVRGRLGLVLGPRSVALERPLG